jgi:fucose permease
VSSRVLARFDARFVLYAALGTGAASVIGLWGFRLLPVGLFMLAIAGMSLGNYFPLILSVAFSQAGDEVERISSGSAQAIGIALLAVPLALAYLGDQIGLVDAIGLLALLPLVMLALLFSADSRSMARSHQTVSP